MQTLDTDSASRRPYPSGRHGTGIVRKITGRVGSRPPANEYLTVSGDSLQTECRTALLHAASLATPPGKHCDRGTPAVAITAGVLLGTDARASWWHRRPCRMGRLARRHRRWHRSLVRRPGDSWELEAAEGRPAVTPAARETARPAWWSFFSFSSSFSGYGACACYRGAYLEPRRRWRRGWAAGLPVECFLRIVSAGGARGPRRTSVRDDRSRWDPCAVRPSRQTSGLSAA